MGSQSCCPHKDYDQQVIYNLQSLKRIQQQQNQNSQRKGFPSNNFAIELNQLIDVYKQKDQLKYIQDIIRDLKQNQKNKLKKIYVKIPSIPKNQLPQPYYIPNIQAFYIGQWIFYSSKIFKDNVPGGIGRLYQKQWISQGAITTSFPKIDEAKQQLIQYADNQNGWGQMFLNQSQKNKLQGLQFVSQFKEQKKMPQMNSSTIKQLIAKKFDKVPYFQIFLDGYGRKFNKSEQMIGYFKSGLLHGRQSKWQIKQPKYTYVGEWNQGQRHGRGIQTTDLTQYSGDFVKNRKTGNGTLIFKLSNQKQNERIIQQAKIRKKMTNQNQNEAKSKIKYQLWKQKQLRRIISEKLKQFEWKPSFNQQTSKFEDQIFLFQRKIKQKFVEMYSGQFKDDQMHGKGVYTWYNGKTFSGQFINGKIQGVGQFYWPDNVIYRGQYKNDKKHGKGQIIWSSRRRYRGSWAFGIRHGYGQSISIDQDVLLIKGSLWKQDKQMKNYFKQKISIQGFSQIQKMTFEQYTIKYNESQTAQKQKQDSKDTPNLFNPQFDSFNLVQSSKVIKQK